ncbi:MAG: hypothetical protein WCV73_00530 [Patescibacteria group bacterium]|jgi:cell division protein FtsL
MFNKQKTSIISHKFLNNSRTVIYFLSLSSVFAYLLVVNNTNTLGIKMGQMKYQIQTLSDTNRDLESLATSLQAMARIEQISNTELSMVTAGTYDYILPVPGEVALSN